MEFLMRYVSSTIYFSEVSFHIYSRTWFRTTCILEVYLLLSLLQSPSCVPAFPCMCYALSTKLAWITESHNYRMAWVERDLKDHSVPTAFHGQGHFPTDQAAYRPIQHGLEYLQGQGNLLPGLTNLFIENLFLMCNANLPFFHLKPSSLVLSLHSLMRSSSPTFL